MRWISFAHVLLGCSMMFQAGAVLGESTAGVPVMAEGSAPFLPDMSLEEVRGRARGEARRNAIEQAAGVFIRATSVVHNSQIADELVTAVARGVIEDEQWIEEKIEKTDAPPAGSSMSVYRAKVKAVVRPVKIERRAGFELAASLNKQIYQDGEEALIKIQSNRSAYLHVFSVTQDGSVTLLLPNRFVTKTLIAADQEIVFPSDGLRELGVRLRVALPRGAGRAIEHIKVIATRQPLALVKAEERSDGVFRTFAGSEGDMIHHVMKRLALLDDEDWTETTLPYQVRQ